MVAASISKINALFVVFTGIIIILIVSTILIIAPDSLNAMSIFFLLVGAVVLLIGLWLLSLSNRVHPCIKKFYSIKLNPNEIKRLADSGQNIPIQLGKIKYQLQVKSCPLFEDSFNIIWVSEKKERIEKISEAITYEGTVLDNNKTSEVRLTITDTTVEGYVKINSAWWFIEPLKKFRLKAESNDFIAYKTSDLKFKLDLYDDLIPEHITDGKVFDPPQEKQLIGINFAIDAEYLWQAEWTSLSAYQQNLSLLNVVNGVYKSEVGCEFVLKNLVVDQDTLTSTDGSTLLNQLENTVNNTSLGDLGLFSQRVLKKSEVVHLTSGKNLNGKLLGIARFPGVYGLSQQQLIWVGGGGGLFGGAPNLAYMNLLIMAHEVGHNFNGDHDEATKRCVWKIIKCLDNVRTIMWPTIYDDNEAIFSDGSRDDSKNNQLRIKRNFQNRKTQNY